MGRSFSMRRCFDNSHSCGCFISLSAVALPTPTNAMHSGPTSYGKSFYSSMSWSTSVQHLKKYGRTSGQFTGSTLGSSPGLRIITMDTAQVMIVMLIFCMCQTRRLRPLIMRPLLDQMTHKYHTLDSNEPRSVPSPISLTALQW
jgi:hypothetical protein